MDYVNFIRSKVGHEKIFLNFAAGILPDEFGRILLQKRADKEVWDFPGGCMELGEYAVETLLREFKEETTLEVEPVRFLGAYTNCQVSYPNGDEAQAVGLIYEVAAKQDLTGIERVKTEESLELRFFSQEEIEVLTLEGPHSRAIIEDYFLGTYPLRR